MSVSRETEARLSAYADLLRRWNPKINLIAPATVAQLETRHIADCLQVAALAGPMAGNVADLGSGGGLPGLVLAITGQDSAAQFTLVESDRRKAAFLRTVIRDLSLQRTAVEAARIEVLAPLEARIVTARALAPLDRLMPYVRRHLARGGTAWLMKGRNWRSELQGLPADAKVTAHPSRTEPDAAILEVTFAP